MHKRNVGKQATRSQQLMLQTLIPKRSVNEVIVIHHVTDTHYKLQLEIERRCPVNGIKFERVIL
jgi:hypothetical protein